MLTLYLKMRLALLPCLLIFIHIPLHMHYSNCMKRRKNWDWEWVFEVSVFRNIFVLLMKINSDLLFSVERMSLNVLVSSLWFHKNRLQELIISSSVVSKAMFNPLKHQEVAVYSLFKSSIYTLRWFFSIDLDWFKIFIKKFTSLSLMGHTVITVK